MNRMSLRPNPRLALLITTFIAVIGGGLLITRPDLSAFVCALPLSDGQLAAYRDIPLETVYLLRTQRGLTTENICRMPQDKLDRAIWRAFNPKPDYPGEAVEFRNLQLQDENGYIPPDGLINAALHIEEMGTNQVSAAGAGINSGSWTWLGPGNIGGRVRALVIHPTNSNTMWAGSVSGGIWKTTNGGASWAPVDDFMANLAVATIVMQPGNERHVCCIGRYFYNADATAARAFSKHRRRRLDSTFVHQQLNCNTSTGW